LARRREGGGKTPRASAAKRPPKSAHKAAHKGAPAQSARAGRSAGARLPATLELIVTGTDHDGDALARPLVWDRADGPPPAIRMLPERPGEPALAPGQRILARLRPLGGDRYQGRTLERIGESQGRILGLYRATPDRGQEGRIAPTDRRAKAEWLVPPGESGGAESGEIVLATPLPAPRLGLKPARILERLGRLGDARSVSLICIHANDIPTEFAPAALAEAGRARPVPLGRRSDLRDLPLITIDGEDARDFDDAVFAEATEQGWRLVVAIADVAHYVRPASALDLDAARRGNSVYFPDRVVPMLPEALSNGLCSLQPGQERGCLFVEITLGRDGRKRGHRFGRGLMRSAARTTYEQIQAAADAKAAPAGLPERLLRDLYDAFAALLAARTARGTLDLDLPERKVVLAPDGSVAAITPRPRLDSHRLIEEFMVLANVCAAEELERVRQFCMYRVHAPPSEEKLFVLRSFLHGVGISLPAYGQLHPRDLSRVLAQVAGTDQATLISEVVLRSQSLAAYSPDNIGHFGLALPRYAHFTSPIRRYADLLVHRGLIAGLGLGDDGRGDDGLAVVDGAGFANIAERINAAERRAVMAERDAIDRYLAAYLSEMTGHEFDARISGVTRFGLFVTLAQTGANGLVPFSGLPDDFWECDEAAHTLTGRRSGAQFRLSQPVRVHLVEANRLTGGMSFRILAPAAMDSPPPSRSRAARRAPAARSRRPPPS
jgi:ribonuclease R